MMSDSGVTLYHMREVFLHFCVQSSFIDYPLANKNRTTRPYLDVFGLSLF